MPEELAKFAGSVGAIERSRWYGRGELAGLAMSSLLRAHYLGLPLLEYQISEISKAAVLLADALVAELKATEPPPASLAALECDRGKTLMGSRLGMSMASYVSVITIPERVIRAGQP